MTFAASSPSAQRASLLSIDPELGELLPAERRRTASRSLKVAVLRIARRDFELGRLAATSPTNLGLLIVQGIVAREVTLGDIVSAELLGAGDLIRPWTLEAGNELLESTTRWTALSDDLQVALLDRRFAAELAQFPEVNTALLDRLNARSARLAKTQAISQLTRVDRRLIAFFTHLAERWGRMTSNGVMVPLRLSHNMLARLVGARRPTVSSALRRLAESGELVRRSDGAWIVHGQLAPNRDDSAPIQPRRAVLMSVPERTHADDGPAPAIELSALRKRFQRARGESEARAAALTQSFEATTLLLQRSRARAREVR